MDNGWRPRDTRDNDSSRASEGEFRIRGNASRRYNDYDNPRRGGDRRSYPREQPSYRHEQRRDSDWDYDPTVDSYLEHAEPPPNTGENDSAPRETRTKFLLVRGLKANVDEHGLAKILSKFYLDDSVSESPPGSTSEMKSPPQSMPLPTSQAAGKPSPVGATPNSLARVFIIRDRRTNKSMKYGFAEYHSSQDATRVLDAQDALGTTSSEDKVQCTPVDPGVFAPVIGVQGKNDAVFSFSHNGGLYYYRDTRYYASPEIVNPDPPQLALMSGEPPERIKAQENKKRSNKALDSAGAGPSKKAKMNLEFANKWQQKQQELRGETGGSDDDDSESKSKSNPSTDPDPKMSLTGANHQSDAVTTIPQSFIWRRKVKGVEKDSCLLCFTDLLKITPEAHVRESEKHINNLKDDAAYKRGFERMKQRGVDEDATVKIKPDKPVPSKQETFTDRAALRREQEAKADNSGRGPKIAFSLGGGGAQQQKKQGPPTSSSPPSAPTAPSYGKGMSMLQKHGWKAGEALGSGDGEGLTAPIETSMYAAGVGLGHEGGKMGDAVEEASRSTRGGGAGFVEKTKDVARERFEKMG